MPLSVSQVKEQSTGKPYRLGLKLNPDMDLELAVLKTMVADRVCNVGKPGCWQLEVAPPTLCSCWFRCTVHMCKRSCM